MRGETSRMSTMIHATETTYAAAPVESRKNRPEREDSSSPYIERIAVKKARRILLLWTEDIDMIEAAGNYVRLCSQGQGHLYRTTMRSLERKLDPNRFLRIHRSTIVNVDRIREVLTTPSGDYVAILADGTRTNWSRGYRRQLNEFLSRQT